MFCEVPRGVGRVTVDVSSSLLLDENGPDREGGRPGPARDPFGPGAAGGAYCTTPANRRVLRFLQTAIAEATPVTLLLGPAGAGKTALLRRLAGAPVRGLQIGMLGSGPGGLFSRLLAAFGQPVPDGAARDAFLRFCVSSFEEGRMSLLLIDDAQSVAVDDLATLAQLISVRPGMTCPLVLLLSGRPEAEERLDAAGLSGRVGASIALSPMSAEETAGYVRHRLAVANAATGLFDDEALRVVHDRAGGLPGRVDGLCARAVEAADGGPVGAALVASLAPPWTAGPARAGAGSRPAGRVRTAEPDADPRALPVSPLGPTEPGGARMTADERSLIEALRGVPGYLATVRMGREPVTVHDRGWETEGAEPVLSLAHACLAASSTPIMTATAGAVCLADPARGLAVAGGRGLNLGFVRRILRGLPQAPVRCGWSPDAPAAFSERWRTALWRLAQVVDRTASPRRLTFDREGAPSPILADGRIEMVDRGDLVRIGEILRRAEGPVRYALAPAAAAPASSAPAADLIAEIHEADEGVIVVDAEGWPQVVPPGSDFAALALALRIGRAMAAADDGARIASLDGPIQRLVASRDGWGRVRIDATWLRAQVARAPRATEPAARQPAEEMG